MIKSIIAIYAKLDRRSIRIAAPLVLAALLILLIWRLFNAPGIQGENVTLIRYIVSSEIVTLTLFLVTLYTLHKYFGKHLSISSTASFTSALGSLHSYNMTSRLGAIYTLRHLVASDSSFRSTVKATLTAFVKDRATPADAQADESTAREPDVQAALILMSELKSDKSDDPYSMTNLSGVFLKGADLSRGNFQGFNFTKSDLQDSKLDEANLQFTDLSMANLSHSNLWGANLQGAIIVNSNLEDCYMHGTNLQGARLNGATAHNADLSNSILQESECEYGDFSNADLADCNAQGVTMTNTSFSTSTLHQANLQHAILTQNSFENAVLAGANLQKSILNNSNFHSADMRGANLQDATATNARFVSADLTNADLQNTNLSFSDLTSAVFFGASLHTANLSNTVLDGADFTNATFTGANLHGASLVRAKLSTCIDLTIKQLMSVASLYQAELDPRLEYGLRSNGFDHLLDEPSECGVEPLKLSDNPPASVVMFPRR